LGPPKNDFPDNHNQGAAAINGVLMPEDFVIETPSRNPDSTRERLLFERGLQSMRLIPHHIYYTVS